MKYTFMPAKLLHSIGRTDKTDQPVCVLIGRPDVCLRLKQGSHDFYSYWVLFHHHIINMKTIASLRAMGVSLIVAGLCLTACKSRTATDPAAPPPASPATPDTSVTTNSTTAVQIESTDSLAMGVKDATKDYPTVTAKVDDGVITLNGELKKTQLPKLMQSVHSLHPKKVVNNLVLK